MKPTNCAQTSRTLLALAIACITAFTCIAVADDTLRWEQNLATRFSEPLRRIQSEIGAIDRELAPLPYSPAGNQGGTGGIALLHENDESFAGSEIKVTWPESRRVDLVALVPARAFSSKVLDSRYGMPEDFTVDLLDAEGKTLRRVSSVRNAWSDPIRQGSPFVFPVEPPVDASGLRVTATSLRPEPESPIFLLHAWAEIFAFDGIENVAAGAKVSLPDPKLERIHWHWNPAFAVDGLTPLGLNEMPHDGHPQIGWISDPRYSENESVWIQLDLGETKTFDTVRLFPTERPRVADRSPGFALPERVRVLVSDTGQAGSFRVVHEQSEDLPSVGNNPQSLRFTQQDARYVRVVATQLWNISPIYPSFFALSELQVLDGNTNLALAAKVSSKDPLRQRAAHGEYQWVGTALTDGYGPKGKLIPRRKWLSLLATRHDLELRKHILEQRAEQIVERWRMGGLSAVTGTALVGGMAIIFLPIRYRIRNRRALRKIRERITGDLHDEVGSNLGSIQIFAKLAASKPQPLEELESIQRIAAGTVSAVRDIVWLLRPKIDQRIGTVEHLRESTAIMMEPFEWTFEARGASQNLRLPDETNRNLFLFHREAMHNILRHAEAKKVDVRVRIRDGIFELQISDDGRGIPIEKQRKPSTLRALRQRCEALLGDLELSSTPDTGTKITLTIPIKRLIPETENS